MAPPAAYITPPSRSKRDGAGTPSNQINNHILCTCSYPRGLAEVEKRQKGLKTSRSTMHQASVTVADRFSPCSLLPFSLSARLWDAWICRHNWAAASVPWHRLILSHVVFSLSPVLSAQPLLSESGTHRLTLAAKPHQAMSSATSTCEQGQEGVLIKEIPVLEIQEQPKVEGDPVVGKLSCECIQALFFMSHRIWTHHAKFRVQRRIAQ